MHFLDFVSYNSTALTDVLELTEFRPFILNICFFLLLNFQSQPVEGFYREQGKLLEFDLPGGIPESWPKLLHVLNLEDQEELKLAAA